MTEKKVEKRTKKELFTLLLAVEGVKGNKEFEDFIKNEISLLEDKQAKAKAKRAKSGEDREKLKTEIFEVLLANPTAMRIAEIQKKNNVLAGLSNQKMSSLLTEMANAGLVVRSVEKKLVYFSASID
jgi:DNA-binding transcriptional regulator GbsR (MarR family)